VSKKKRAVAPKRAIPEPIEQKPLDRQSVTRGLILALLIGFGLISVTSVLNSGKPVNPPSLEDFPSQGQTHIAEGTSHPPYNSNPPTSGWHYPVPVPWGLNQQAIPDEALVYNLEQGGIWLSYRDSNDKQTIQQLTDIVHRYTDHVILTYRPANDRPIAVAAWGHLLKLDVVDDNVILKFITRYIGQGPQII
jgi:hypothetical protein